MKKNKIGVYSILNIINNKIYIGSSVNIRSRWYGHRSKLKHNKHENKYLQNSWNKYGKENFKFKILEEINKKQLKEKELYYMNLFDVFDKNKGYNMCKDPYNSRLGLKNSKNHNKRIGDANRGRIFSDEIVEANRLRNIGRKHSDETKQKMSKSHKKIKMTQKQLDNLLWNKQPVIQFDKKLNKICVFNSITEAKNATNTNNISAVCRGIQKTAGGYIWKYLSKMEKEAGVED